MPSQARNACPRLDQASAVQGVTRFDTTDVGWWHVRREAFRWSRVHAKSWPAA